MSGNEIKALIISSGVKCYEVARELGIAPETFSRQFRKGFSVAEAEKIKTIIERLKTT